MKVGLIVGSLRKESWNKKIAEVVKDLFPKDIEVDFIDIYKLPLYNEDLDGDQPIEEYTALRKAVKDHDAFIFFTPEYNRSYSPAIKNVIDVASKNPDGNPWAKKPAAVFSASTGGFGGMAGNHALRQSFIFTDLIAMQQPEVYLSKVNTLFEDGVINESTKGFLAKAVETFVDHAKKVLA